MSIKLLIGGSPCTHWSIAQTSSNREIAAEGIGWELFKNFLIAKEKFKPDFFLYENNKSASQVIKDQIACELGVGIDPMTRFTYINSALVSAQNRQRFYVTNFGDIQQPEDRGILLKDVLEHGESWQDKSFALTTRCNGAIPSDTLSKHRHTMIAEPLNLTVGNKSQCLRATYYKDGIRNLIGNNIDRKTCVAEPIDYQNFRKELDGKTYSVHEVKNNEITIKGKVYSIKLPDGYYIIRKLSVVECCRLQTMPDDYCKAVSASQAYKGLGNGWTAEVIIHLLSHALKDVPKDEEIQVVSLYDGIGTGRYCLDKMGFTNISYYAYEIDKYAMMVANDNYSDIIQCGDAFAVRDEEWHIGR